MWEILSKLVDEDPCLKIEHVASTNETIVYGLGELHLRMLLERMRETYKFEVNTRPPRIAYRETITAPAEGHHRHKKQTGGAGQFGEVLSARRAAAARCRVRVRRRGQGRRDPNGSSSRRSRRACARSWPWRDCRLPGGGRAGGGL
jgi:predicted membrane GTPase involved in stress response